MYKHLVCGLCTLAGTLCCKAQRAFSFGIHINPIIHYNSGTASNAEFGRMKPFNVGSQAGLEVNYRLDNLITVGPIFKYYRKSQTIEQSAFFGYLSTDSKTWRKFTYESIDLGVAAKYKITETAVSEIVGVAGLSYSFAHQNELNYGHHLVGVDNSAHLGSISYAYTPDGLNTIINMWHPLIGIRGISTIERIGVVEYGFLLYLPTKAMPVYNYDQILETDNAGNIHTVVTYTSHQYSLEVAVIYHIINFNNKFRLIHPK